MTALPKGFRERMRTLLGEEADDFFASYEAERSHALRINTLKMKPEDAKALLPYLEAPVLWAEEGYYYSPAAADGTENRPGKSPLHEAGCYYIQEPSAMAVAALSGVQRGERVLDLCAAPGGKSTQLAAKMAGEGILVSNEISPQRARILSQNIERCGITNAVVTNMDPKALAEAFPSFFDRIIVDAPCSGEGMFKKEQAALDMWSVDNIRLCHLRQLEILDSAAKMLRYGGTLVYSTCTFAPEEDEETIAAFLASHPEYALQDLPGMLGDDFARFGFTAGRPDWCSIDVPEKIREKLSFAVRLFPHRLRGEGHFVARLTRGKMTPSLPVKQVPAGNALEKGRGKKAGRGKHAAAGPLETSWSAFQNFSDENLQGAAPVGTPVLFGSELYLLPADIQLSGLKVLRPGLDLGTLQKDRFVPAHALALSLRQEEAVRAMDLSADSEEASRYLHGEAIPCDPSLKGWVLVTFSGYSAGWGRAAGGMLKNHYPKGLRRPY